MAPEIIAGMQQLALEQRRLLGPRADWHVGDIAWGLRQHEGRESEWKIRLLDRGRTRRRLVMAEAGRAEPARARRPSGATSTCWTRSSPSPRQRSRSRSRTTADRRAALARHGFTEPGDVMHFLVRELAEPPESPPLPDGFRCRTVDDGDVPERVSIHREVWAPSRVTESSYAQVRAEWPYRGVARLRRRGAGRPLRRLLPLLAGRPERRRPSSSRSVRARSSAAAASVLPCARSRSGGCTRKASARRSSTAPRRRRARCTSRSGSAFTHRSSGTRGRARRRRPHSRADGRSRRPSARDAERVTR